MSKENESEFSLFKELASECFEEPSHVQKQQWLSKISKEKNQKKNILPFYRHEWIRLVAAVFFGIVMGYVFFHKEDLIFYKSAKNFNNDETFESSYTKLN